MIRKSVRSVFVAAFILANLALVATPAGAGWDVRLCTLDSGEVGTCCVRCFFFCEPCRDIGDGTGDPDDDNDGEGN